MIPQPERDLIFALFRRIGEQPEFKEAFEKLPNAERNYMAGDFYNIIVSHSNTTTERDKVLKELIDWVVLYRIELAQHVTHSNLYHCNRFHIQLLKLLNHPTPPAQKIRRRP